jgi:hypothetical protein
MNVTLQTSLARLTTPSVFALTRRIFVRVNTPTSNNIVSAIISGPTITTPQRIQIGSSAPLAPVPGTFVLSLHPEARALLDSVFPNVNLGNPLTIDRLMLMLMLASMVLFATFGIALMCFASLQRREPLGLAA